MGGAMSRSKGQRAEREAIKYLQPVVNEVYALHGMDAPIMQRNQLQSHLGGYDIVGCQWLALECKHQETLAVDKWWEQCVAQGKGNAEPVLMYKQNRVKWRVRLWGKLLIHGTLDNFQWHVVELSLEAFLTYFRARLIVELEKEIKNGN